MRYNKHVYRFKNTTNSLKLDKSVYGHTHVKHTESELQGVGSWWNGNVDWKKQILIFKN